MPLNFHNKWPGGPVRFDYSQLPDDFANAEGILPLSVSLDPGIGTETVLLLIDRTDFVYDLAAIQPFNLMTKTGLVRTHYGPLMFAVFWIPTPGQPGVPFAAFECHINPLDQQQLLPWRDLARQSHWHLALLDKDHEQQNFFEFENVYNLDHGLDTAVEACAGMESIDFTMAKQEFCASYDIPQLLKI